MLPHELQQQQEKLRRVVDDWRCQSRRLLASLDADPCSPHLSPSALDPYASGYEPIHLNVEPLEHSDLLLLLQSDNADMSKFVAVLSYDCLEISKLCRQASKRLYMQLTLFGHRVNPNEVVLEGEPQKLFGRSLSLFLELYETVCRLTDVLGNLLQQLNAIYGSHDKGTWPYASLKKVSLRTVFGCLGEGLAVFLTLDEILKRNGKIKGYVSLFSRMLSKVKLDPSTFNMSLEDLDFLDQFLHNIEKVCDGGLFMDLFVAVSPWKEVLQKVKCNRKFLDACAICVNEGLLEVLPLLDTRKEYPLDRRKILPYLVLFLFSCHVSDEIPDKKSERTMREVLQVVPFVYVEGNLRFVILDLLKSHCSVALKSWPLFKEVDQESDTIKNRFLAHLSDVYLRDWQAIKNALLCWIASFQSFLHPPMEGSGCSEYLQFHLRQTIQGVLLSNRMHMLALSLLDLHILLEVPIKREKFLSLCHMITLLKVVKNMFNKKRLEIIQVLPHMINLILIDIEQQLLPVKLALLADQEKKGKTTWIFRSLSHSFQDADTRLSDSLSVILMSLQLLKGGGSRKSLLILSITLDVIQSIGYQDIHLTDINRLLSKLAILVDVTRMVREVTDCSFLYWRKEMLGDWLSAIQSDVGKLSWLQHLIDALSDGLKLLKLGKVDPLMQLSYEKEIQNALEKEILLPLCRDMETDLRLHVHSTHLKGSVHVNPRKTGVQDLSWYLQLDPIRLPSKYIHILVLVERYLSSALYNHVIMSPYDWKVYLEMRHLAQMKYGLALDEDLPVSDYGLEVSEIMNDLSYFSRSYSYDINSQIFFERISDQQTKKTLHLLTMDIVGSSLAATGFSALSDINEKIEKFLTEKFAVLSDLLQDSHIRAHLNEVASVSWLPLTQYETLTSSTGRSPLGDGKKRIAEKLLSVISEIGNVLGLLRILIAGASCYSCNAAWLSCKALEDGTLQISKINDPGQPAPAMLVDAEAKEKMKHIRSCYNFHSLTMLFSERIDLVDFKDFFLIIPALLINLVDSKMQFKPLIKDRESTNDFIVDDGFLMGLAFILKVTGGEESFSRLQWFKSTQKRLEEAVSSADSNVSQEQKKGSALNLLNLWKQGASTKPVGSESHKGINKLVRSQKLLELIECKLNIAKTIMS